MSVLTGRKRFRIVGDFSLRDPDGLVRHFGTGDEMPPDIQAAMTKGEINSHLGCGRLQVIGAPPAPKAVPEPPRPLTVAEVLRNTEGWPRATVVDGRVVDGPRGYEIKVVDRPARDGDLKQVATTGRETPIVVGTMHGQLTATISWIALSKLLAATAQGIR
jgi:hypothetical protein